MEREPPPITVTIPGRGAAPTELLAVGPPPPRRPAVPPSQRWTGAVAAAVLAAGLLAAMSTEPPPAPPRARAVAAPVTGVSAELVTSSDPDGRLVERLDLVVALDATEGLGNKRGAPTEDDVRLLVLSARGLELRLDLPRLLPATRTGRSYTLPLEVRVVDCSVQQRAPRQVRLQLRRGLEPAGVVGVRPGRGVEAVLDRLAVQTCRGPRA